MILSAQLRYGVFVSKSAKSSRKSPGAALNAMRKTFGGPARVMAECPRCGKLLSARERRYACPAHQPPAR